MNEAQVVRFEAYPSCVRLKLWVEEPISGTIMVAMLEIPRERVELYLRLIAHEMAEAENTEESMFDV